VNTAARPRSEPTDPAPARPATRRHPLTRSHGLPPRPASERR